MAVNPLSPHSAAAALADLPSAEGLEAARTDRQAARQFEAYMAQMLVREMRKTVPDGLFSGPAMETFGGMFDQAIAERIADGPGLGLALALETAMGVDSGAPSDPRRALRAFHGPEMLGEAPDQMGRRKGILPLIGRLTSGFGRRVDPLGDGHRMHQGLDIAAPMGSPIGAVEGGKVVFSGRRGGYGNAVVVRHRDGTEALYAHCSSLSVNVGEEVRAGQTIGRVGSTGRSTGPHLHLEFHENGHSKDPLEVYGWQQLKNAEESGHQHSNAEDDHPMRPAGGSR